MASAIPAAFRPALLTLLLLAPCGAAVAQTLDPPQEITLDLDGDGKTDRAVLVAPAADDSTLDLHIHLGKSSGTAPDIVKPAITGLSILTFESPEKGTLSLSTCYGCGARKSYDETLTLVYRDGVLLVGEFSRDWEWYTPFADGTDEFLMGGCRIDYLAGHAWVSEGLEEEVAVKERFTPVRLEDWSSEVRPSICEFQPNTDKKRL